MEDETVVDKPNLVVVHSIGKVGSYSIYKSIQAIGPIDVLHTHQLNQDTITDFVKKHGTPGHIKDSLYFLNEIPLDVPVKLITPVREPVARNISAFFENLKVFGFNPPYEEIDVDVLLNGFMERYPHDLPSTWFDDQYEKPLGIDVFSHSFGLGEEGTVITSGRFEVLLLRLEDSNKVWEERIRAFLGLTDFKLKSLNVGDGKDYGGVYGTFKSRLALPVAFLDQMYSTTFARHFYSDEEIESYRKKWSLI